MNRMEQECRKTGLYWVVAVSGSPIGQTWNGDTYSQKQLERPGTLPTQRAAERVGRAFGKWLRQKYPQNVCPRGSYFIASAEGPYKAFPSRRPESETARRANGNHFADQGEAYIASQALKWLCDREREAFEKSSAVE